MMNPFNLIIKTIEADLTFFDQLRFVGTVTVTGYIDWNFAQIDHKIASFA